MFAIRVIPADPVQYACQKNFVIVITDGEPTRDDFDNSGGPGDDWGFERFFQVVGDYNNDGEVETPAYCSGDECAFYLDDIAKWAQDNDLRPDVLWHSQKTGDLYVWFMDGPTTLKNASYLTPTQFADTRWQIRGVADLDVDGHPDLLWHNQATGELYAWFLNDASG